MLLTAVTSRWALSRIAPRYLCWLALDAPEHLRLPATVLDAFDRFEPAIRHRQLGRAHLGHPKRCNLSRVELLGTVGRLVECGNAPHGLLANVLASVATGGWHRGRRRSPTRSGSGRANSRRQDGSVSLLCKAAVKALALGMARTTARAPLRGSGATLDLATARRRPQPLDQGSGNGDPQITPASSTLTNPGQAPLLRITESPSKGTYVK